MHCIGPNAITRIAQALGADGGKPTRDSGLAERVFAAAGLSHLLAAPPEAMVDERHVLALHLALVAVLGEARACAVSAQAGRLTGDYLLAHRIPRAAQAALRLMPARLALRILCAAIGKHAWTFAGSGRFAVRPGRSFALALETTPLAAAGPVSLAYFEATFQRVFAAMLGDSLTVEGRMLPGGFGFTVAWRRDRA
jgi:divinyl protochlorophyllide a 8-vinyl-reductase